MEKRNQAAKLLIGAVIVIIAVLFLAGIVGRRDLIYTPETPDTQTGAETPAAALTQKENIDIISFIK